MVLAILFLDLNFEMVLKSVSPSSNTEHLGGWKQYSEQYISLVVDNSIYHKIAENMTRDYTIIHSSMFEYALQFIHSSFQ